jgi:hypothetical protein
VFVRVETVGLIHLKNTGNLKDPQRRADLYFEKYEKDRKRRDPDLDGRIVGKNTLLLTSLASCLHAQPLGNDTNSDEAISTAIVRGIQAAIAVHIKGYNRKNFLAKGTDDQERFKKWTEPAAEVIPCRGPGTTGKAFNAGDRLPEIVRIKIPVRVLSSTQDKPWHILNEMLDENPGTKLINVALAVVAEGPYTVLNRTWEEPSRSSSDGNEEETPGTDQRVRGLLKRESWDPPVRLHVPIIQFGKLPVVGREETEELCGINNLFSLYIREREHYEKPLSIAVFGPPGTGKSFAVKEIADTIDPSRKLIEILEYNIAQFTSTEELGRVFQRVGSINNAERTPLIFFDEFDCSFDKQPLGWLKFFLAPMQDGNFYGAAGTINIGRGIFVFAGGTHTTFQKFSKAAEEFGAQKGPDFISRLRGHINIKHLNAEPGSVPDFMRRAIVLRGLLEKHNFTRKTSDNGEQAMIDEAVIYSLLTAREYRHGVRSIEAFLQMCTSIDGYIQIGSIPARFMHMDASEFFHNFRFGRARQNENNRKRYTDLGEAAPKPSRPVASTVEVSEINKELERMLLCPTYAAIDVNALKELKKRIEGLSNGRAAEQSAEDSTRAASRSNKPRSRKAQRAAAR